MHGFSSRLRFLAAFGWCRNDMGEPPPVGITYFRTNDILVQMTLELIPSKKPAHGVS